jgi:hypothetical protein
MEPLTGPFVIWLMEVLAYAALIPVAIFVEAALEGLVDWFLARVKGVSRI